MKPPPGPTSHRADKIMTALRHSPARTPICLFKALVAVNHILRLACHALMYIHSMSRDRVAEEVVYHVENNAVDNGLITGHVASAGGALG